MQDSNNRCITEANVCEGNIHIAEVKKPVILANKGQGEHASTGFRPEVLPAAPSLLRPEVLSAAPSLLAAVMSDEEQRSG